MSHAGAVLTATRRRVLYAASAWTLYVWGTRVVLIWGGDESTGFKVVHTVLAVVSIGFAAAVFWIARASRERRSLAS